MAADFRELLSTPMDSIERPKPWPAGTYTGVILRHSFEEIGQNKTAACQMNIRLDAPGEDVDPEALAEALNGVEMSKRVWKKNYFLTPEARYRLKEMLESVNVPCEGRNLGECIPEATNASIIVTITQRTSQDGKDIFNDVGDVRGA